MGLLDILKKKQPPPLPPPFPEQEGSYGPPTDTPLESVLIMRQQGLTNPQIIQALQRQGYTATLIAQAMSQAELHGGSEPYTPPEPVIDETPPPTHQQPTPTFSNDALAQVQQTLTELRDELKTLKDWKEEQNETTTGLNKQFQNLQEELKTIHQAVFAQIQEYNKTLKGVGTEIVAMEKVFSQSLPELTGSIQDLQRVTKQLKEPTIGKGKTTSK